MCDSDDGPPEEEMECVCVPKVQQKKKVLEMPCCCPNDPRFQNQNQTRRCIVNFIDYHRCIRLLGPYQGCRIFKKCYMELCPTEWQNAWHEQMEKGTWPYISRLPAPKDGEVIEPDESEPFQTAGY